MNIAVCIQDGPLPDGLPAEAASVVAGQAGAVVCFEGVVRACENGRSIAALDYEIYEPMATRELRRLAEDVWRSFGLLAVSVTHSRGRVAAGQCAFRLRVVAAHRGEALRAMEVFIDRLKQDVPIWKQAVYTDAAESS
jgi:molybdopterin synthase catalytic subunit